MNSKRTSFPGRKGIADEYVRPQEGGVQKKELDLNEMVEILLIPSRSALSIQVVRSSTDIEAIDSGLYVDEVHFQNVIFNLMDNAVKYRKPDEPLNITMKTWNDEEHLYLSITDTGLGMKKENLKKIFDKFYRVHTRQCP